MAKKIGRETSLQELIGIVSEHLLSHGISSVLTGGSVVSVYTDNQYESNDLDFISPFEQKELVKVMALLGFKPATPHAKDLVHDECPISVEFPGRTVMLGAQPEKVTHDEMILGRKVRMLSPTQSVQDRLAGFIHWNDPQSLDQAEWVSEKQPVSLDKVLKWALAEGASQEKMLAIETRLRTAIKKFRRSGPSPG